MTRSRSFLRLDSDQFIAIDLLSQGSALSFPPPVFHFPGQGNKNENNLLPGQTSLVSGSVIQTVSKTTDLRHQTIDFRPQIEEEEIEKSGVWCLNCS